MSEYVFKPLPPDIANNLATLATSVVGEPELMNVDSFEDCAGGPARFWQVGREDQICVTIYSPDARGNACAHADGIEPDSPLGKLCQSISDDGYGHA
ncbi:MAG: hypothetical protein AAB557_05295 [Patescibacteria group bacterium]